MIPFQRALGRLDIAALDIHLHAKLAHFVVKVVEFVCVLLRTLLPETFEGDIDLFKSVLDEYKKDAGL